ncbi:ABC transporter permease family protein [Veronia nyctiphanis]|nr:hypothetical protein [Veronia nyctiphanis]
MLKDIQYLTILALRDISHEKILSFCMACSLGAIFTPIIILLGLQKGIIGNMIDALESDPTSRLVRPKFMSQSPIPEETLEVIKNAGAAFIESETSHLLLDVKGLSDPINVVPSSDLDPFFIKSKASLTNNDSKWVLISESLSKKLGKYEKDILTIMLVRFTKNNYREEIPVDFSIVGVLDKEVMPDYKIHMQDSIFNDIYHWRKGYASKKLNLEGNREINILPEYDGAITTFGNKRPNTEDFNKMLAGRFPFSTLPIKYSKSDEEVGQDDSLLWKAVNSTITKEEIQELNNTLLNYGYSPRITPYVDNVKLSLFKGKIPKSWKVKTLSISESPLYQQGKRPILLVSNSDAEFVGAQRLILKTGLGKKTAIIPVELMISDKVPHGYIVPSYHFTGLLRSAIRIGAVYSEERFSFELENENLTRYFRVYSKSLDDLELLVDTVKNEGERLGVKALVSPVSKLNDVRNIQKLSNYMEKIYLLIASISGISTIFAVTASVYATVQRRKKDIAYLNMLGINKSKIVFFPLIKNMILILFGLSIAFSAYWLFDMLAKNWFVDLLGETESLTRLTSEYILGLISIVLLLGSLSSLFAATAINKIDSKRYIHE